MILSAQFANAERTAVVVITDDRGAVSISPDRPALWAEYLAWPGVTAPFVPIDLSATDQAALNAILIEDGSILRAVIAVLRSEINIVRAAVVPALPARTVAQVTAALKAQMRT